MILHLLLDEFPKVNPFVEGVCLSPRIADPTFRIKVFGNLTMHQPRSESQEHAVLAFITL
jgi:hypothetical protein